MAERFLEWTDYLDERRRERSIKKRTAYDDAAKVATVLDEVLERDLGLMRRTRLSRGGRERPWRRHGADIHQTFKFGHALCDISDALTVEAIRGKLPIPIRFRTGQLFEHWSGKREPDSLRTLKGSHSGNRRVVLEHLRAWEADTSLRTRQSVVNLRIQAEILIFVAQTGMNWSQVWKLKIGKFAYQSHSDGYLVRRVFKGRRQGEVAFEIFREYRPFIERYLTWRNTFFTDEEDGFLFPLIGRGSQRRSLSAPCERLSQVRRVCETVEVDFVGPSLLRKVRTNWLARRSGDLDQTAQMSQHTKQVLLRNYLEPDPDVALTEISRYFRESDTLFSPPGPGACAAPEPKSLPDLPLGAPRPDCVSPAGCMFCSHQRDIDNADHVWSLVSYRHLKTIELAVYRLPSNKNAAHPAVIVIERVTEKINMLEQHSKLGTQWVNEAKDRMKEGDFHPMWSGFIELAEALI